MFNVRLAGGHLYGKQLFTWLSLAVSMMASFVLSFFPLDVLDEIWDLIESVSEGFLTYSYIKKIKGIFCAQKKTKKISIVIKNVIWSEVTLMHKAEGLSNYFIQFFHV